MRFRHSMVLVLLLLLPTAVRLAADANDLPDGTVEFGESRYLLVITYGSLKVSKVKMQYLLFQTLLSLQLKS